MITRPTRHTGGPAAVPAAPSAALNGYGPELRYDGKPVVHGVSVDLAAGRVAALVGPNGSGKSTLLRALSRLHRTDGGRVALGGRGGRPERDAAPLSAREFVREQRVRLAACLARETGVVLLDEPTNHLGLRHRIETLDLVRDLVDEHGIAVGIVLHDLDRASRVADTLVLLRSGRVHAAGAPTGVLTADNIGEVYAMRVEAAADPRTGRLRTDPIGRHLA
jgi:ABC-type cobalamin/Fe3+-siderophores transport system ATPase subunit